MKLDTPLADEHTLDEMAYLDDMDALAFTSGAVSMDLVLQVVP